MGFPFPVSRCGASWGARAVPLLCASPPTQGHGACRGAKTSGDDGTGQDSRRGKQGVGMQRDDDDDDDGDDDDDDDR